MSYSDRLATPSALWWSFALTVVCTVAFQAFAARYGLVLLDAITNPDLARATIAAMTPAQRSLHAWITASIDVVFPLAYGALFIGTAYRFFPTPARWLAIAILILVATDLLEGAVQILGLTGVVDWLDAKAILTPAKLWLFYFGLGITVSGWIAWLAGKVRARRRYTDTGQ